jgi:GNAT superfamily N-acetyltransferase
MDVTLRLADDLDLPDVLRLLAILDPPEAVPLTLPEARRILARIERYPDYGVWVAEHERRVVGIYSLLIMDNLGHRGAPAGVVENVAVDPACQGQGVGKAMMEHARGRCRARGCYKMALSSNQSRTAAHAFYESLGFSRHGFSFLIDP